MLTRFAHLLLILEFLILCIGLPSIVIFYRLAPFMFAFLWGATLYCWFIFRVVRHHHETLKTLWKWEAITPESLRIIIPRWIIACVAMTVFIYYYDPDRMFGLFDRMPIWGVPLLVVMYTFLSALPQEFIFCTFFFDRYKRWFKTDRARIIASAIVFAYAHVLFINPVAPALSLIAGLIFASTYARTRSLALVTLEHGLYGGWLFIVGLGWYFYGGAVAMH